jgi:hypothetical protein
MISSTQQVQFARHFSRVWSRAAPEARRLLDQALVALQWIQMPPSTRPSDLQSPMDWHDRCLAQSHRWLNHDADLADRLKEAAWVFLDLDELRQNSANPGQADEVRQMKADASMHRFATDFKNNTQSVTFSVAHTSAEAMWGYAARVELALTLARQRPLKVGHPAVILWMNQVASLSVLPNLQFFSVTTRIDFLPRSLTRQFLRQQQMLALDRLTREHQPRAWLAMRFQRLAPLVFLAEDAALDQVSESIHGLKQVPEAADRVRLKV